MKKITIDGKDIEISDESFEAFKEQFIKEDKRWRAFKKEDNKIFNIKSHSYYYINTIGKVSEGVERGNDYCNYHFNTKNYYKTEKKAERALEIFNILRKYAWDDITEEEFKNKQIDKWKIEEYNGKITCDCCSNYLSNGTLFKTLKDCQSVIYEIGYDDFITYCVLGGIR